MEDGKRRPLGWAGLGRAGLDLSVWDILVGRREEEGREEAWENLGRRPSSTVILEMPIQIRDGILLFFDVLGCGGFLFLPGR